jgi:hypothetical protein
MFCFAVRGEEFAQSILQELEQWESQGFLFSFGTHIRRKLLVCIRNGYTVIDNYEPHGFKYLHGKQI